MADLSSILGGMVQGFKDFGTGLVDMFGTGGAAIGDAIESIRTGRATNKNQDDFRKWLYQTDDTQDAAAKGLGTILNGVQTVSDFIPGAGAITRNPLFNGVQGAIGGVADEFKMAGKDYDLGRAAQRAGVGAASGLASAYTNQALGKSGSKLINNGLVRGAAGGALAGGIANAGYTGIEGGSVQDMINAGLYGAQTGALVGGTTGLARELIKPTHKMDASPLTEQEKAARIANIDDQIGKLDLNTPEGNARYNELMDARQKYSGNKRLYRGLTQEYDANYPKNKLDTQGYESWTDNPELARQYGENVYYIDVPEGDIKTSYLDENPMSETYGDRNPIYSIDKKAGLNGVSGNEYLLSVDDPYKEGLTYNRLGGKPKTVADLMLSPEQKEYFKDSVIRDENGNLKPMYHGTRGDFTVFGDDKPYDGSNSHASVGHWFTPTEEGAKNFANSIWYGDGDPKAMKTYLNMKNPKIYETVDNSAAIEPLAKRLQELEAKSLTSGKLSGTQLYYDDMYKASVVQNMVNQGNEDMAVKWLSDKGYSKENAANLVDEIADIKRLANEKANLQNEISELKYGDAYQRFKTDLYKVDGQTADDANAGGVGMALNDKNSIKKYVDNLKNEGYDGIIIKGTRYDADVMGGPNDQYVVFDSNQIKSVDNLRPTADPDIMYSKIPDGQLGLFDQPIAEAEVVDAVNSKNPYAPVDGKVTKAMRDRYNELMASADGFNQITDNELYNKIDKSTLPKGYDKLQQLLDNQMGENNKVAAELKKGIGTDMPLQADLEKLADYVYGDEINGKNTFLKDLDDSIRLNRKNAEFVGIDAEQAEADARSHAKQKLVSKAMEKAERKVIDDIVGTGDSDDILYALQNYRRRGIRTGRAGALDTALSERLGIAPGNTVKITDVTSDDHLKSGSLGRYARNARDIALSDINSPEGKISTMAHERLHSFQNEARPESAGRYSPEVAEAYRELQKDLGHHYKSHAEIRKHWKKNVDYYANSGEQESRMFQQYLENKGYTDNSAYRGLMNQSGEWGNEINPAFDKFINKLRALSKKGVALPAVTALLGGGAIAGALSSGKDDKKKKSEVK